MVKGEIDGRYWPISQGLLYIQVDEYNFSAEILDMK